MDFPGLAVSGVSHHRGQTLSAEQLPCQKIDSVCRPSSHASWIRFHSDSLLHFVIQFVADDPGDAALDSNIVEDVHAPVPFVLEYLVKTAFCPLETPACFDTTLVEAPGNVDKAEPRGHLFIYLLDDFSRLLVDFQAFVCTDFIPVRRGTVRPALLRIVQHAPTDILCHVFNVKLVHGHHVPEGEAAGGCVVEILFHIDTFYAVVHQQFRIDHGLKHVPAHAVGLPGDDILERSLFGIGQHLLELRAPVCLAGDGPICIGVNDSQLLCFGLFHAGFDLLLNAGVFLVVRRIPGIDYSLAPGVDSLARHYLASFAF